MVSLIDPTFPVPLVPTTESVRDNFQHAHDEISALQIAIASLAPLTSPAFTGNPTAPTPNVTDADTSIATTAFVAGLASNYLPLSGGAVTGPITVRGAAGTARSLIGDTGTVKRWEMQLGDTTAETGSNAGSNFALEAMDDSGATNGVMLKAYRAGQVEFPNPYGLFSQGITLFGGPGTYRSISGNTGTTPQNLQPRWGLSLGDGTPETGGNAGSNAYWGAYGDTGGFYYAFSISRATQVVSFSQPIVNGSDRRMKSDIEPVTGALDIIGRLRGVYYKHKDMTGRRQVGLVAQDVIGALPEVVFETPPASDPTQPASTDTGDDPLLGIAYPNMVAVLIEAIKELKSELDAIKARPA